MTSSSRFAVAVHILALLALDHGKLVTSESIAGSVGTNPVVIRRLVRLLRQAGLVISQPGTGGGNSLARSAQEITLLEVYGAVETGDLFSHPHHRPNPHCLCGRNIEAALRPVLRQAEAAMEAELARVTVAQIAHQVETMGNLKWKKTFRSWL